MSRPFHAFLLATAIAAAAGGANAQASDGEMMCEGRSARITRTFADTARNETPITFMLRLDLANRQATIMGVQGSRVIRPGRHPLTGGPGQAQIVMNWTDSTNVPRSVTVTFGADGSFFGQTDNIPVNAQGSALACGLVGPELCGMMSASSQTEISGVCWARD